MRIVPVPQLLPPQVEGRTPVSEGGARVLGGSGAQGSPGQRRRPFFRRWVSAGSACPALHRCLGSFLSRIEKGDGDEEEDLRLACRHERYPARKWPHAPAPGPQVLGRLQRRKPGAAGPTPSCTHGPPRQVGTLSWSLSVQVSCTQQPQPSPGVEMPGRQA